MAMDLLEMSIILVDGMRFFYKHENSFTVDDFTSLVGYGFVRFFLVCQIPIYGDIVVEYVLVRPTPQALEAVPVHPLRGS